MTIITNNMKAILIVSGVITSSMFYAVIAPEAALMQSFGTVLSGPLAEIIVRSWGALITLVGLMLIYGAYKPVHRSLVVSVASISKIVFISLIFIFGAEYVAKAMPVIIFDGLVVVIFVLYLLQGRQSEV